MAPADSPSVDVVAPYPFHLHAAARELADRRVLGRLLTCYPARYVRGVDRRLVRSRPALAAVRRGVGRRARGADAVLNRIVLADFDRWAARRVEAPVAIASAGLATRTLAAAQRHGGAAVVDRGSWHVLEQRQVLDAEADRWGWPRTRFDGWTTERELSEYETADLIIVPSEPARQSFLRRGVSPERLAKVPYGVGMDDFSPGDGRDPGRVVCVAEVSLQKGHQYLVPAYRATRSPSTSLVLVGPCSRAAGRRLDLGRGDIVVTGVLPRRRVAEELRRAAVFVLASVHDGLALVVAQAMASGTAVVATEATGAGELLDHGVEGFLVRSGDADGLAAALHELLADPERARSMGRAGRAKVERWGGWNSYGDRLLATLASAART